MAVSGRKASKFKDSLSKGSAEDFDHSCDPCQVAGKHVEAEGYCVNCREYLCKSCFTYHQRLKATKQHQLLDKSNMPKHAPPIKDSDVCTESCPVHGNEIIKYFCTKHEELGCTDCIKLHHKGCDPEFIPGNCAGIGDSDEYGEIMQKLDQKVREVEEIIKIATVRDKEIDNCLGNIMKDVIKFRKEINDRLDQLQKRIQADADKKKTTDKQVIQSVLKTCNSVSSDVKKCQNSLRNNKSSGKNGNLYIAMKRAQSNLRSDDVKKVEESLAETDMQYRFERNQDMEKVMSKPDNLGNIVLSAFLVTPRKKRKFDKLTHKEDIKVRTKSDKKKCIITGCTVLSSDKVVLADIQNKKIKVVDTKSKIVIEEKSLDLAPASIAVLPQDQIVVTTLEKKEILILSTSGKLSIDRRIPVAGKSNGVFFHQDQIYVICHNPYGELNILDMQGNVKDTVAIDNSMFSSPNYILFSEISGLYYISDFSSNSVASITLKGKTAAIYKHSDLRGPLGMAMLDDGSMLVCTAGNNSVQRITGDLKQSKTVIDRLQVPQCVCYDHYKHQVFVGNMNCDDLKVFSFN